MILAQKEKMNTALDAVISAYEKWQKRPNKKPREFFVYREGSVVCPIQE